MNGTGRLVNWSSGLGLVVKHDKLHLNVQFEDGKLQAVTIPFGALAGGSDATLVVIREEILSQLHADAESAEQLRVQLAGCSVVAMGGTSPPHLATRGMYGWSPAYDDVLRLRRALDHVLGSEYLGPVARREVMRILSGELEPTDENPSASDATPEAS